MKALVVLVLIAGLFMVAALAIKHMVIAAVLVLFLFVFVGLLSSALE